MARVVAFIPDLLFGSNVVGALQAGGHEPVLVSDAYAVRRELPDAQVLVVDLTADARERLERLEQLDGIPGGAVRTLAFYSHVEVDVRTQAERAGFDMVVPRSRMAREGASLVDRLVESERG
jgi:hypothetical protein